MRAPPTFLHSPKLAFDRPGKQLLVIEPDAIAVVDLERSKTLRIEEPLARAAIGFEDQIWIATRDDRLARYTPAGELIGTSTVLPFADPESFAPAPCGTPAALWGDVGFRLDDGHLVRTELVAEMTLPLAHRRQLTARGGKLVMPTGVSTALPAPLLGGAVLADGGHAILVLDGRVRQLALLAIGTAQITARMPAPGGILRLATMSGHVLALPDPRTLVVVEPRGQREVATIPLDRDVRDFAVDPAGGRIVIRDASGGVEVLELRELIRWSAEVAAPPAPTQFSPAPTAVLSTSTVVAESVGGVCTWEPVHVEEVEDATDERALVVPAVPLRALSPRAEVAPCARSVVLAQLQHELQRVALWSLYAIAVGWDTRRIGYGNEGKHPYELEVAAILGMHSGHATEYVAAAVDKIMEHDAAIAGDPEHRAPGTPIGRLARELGLSERAIDVLLVIAAGALWGEVARLYGILANDSARATVDELVVQQVLAGHYDRHDVSAELELSAPLVRLGLVHVSSRRARPFAELEVEPVVLDLLRGNPPQLDDATTVRAADRTLAELDVPPAVLTAAMTDLARAGNGQGRIVVSGRTGSGRKTLLAAFAGAAGRELAVIDALALPRTADRFVVALRQTLRRSHLAGYLPCIAHLDEVSFDERAGRDVAAEPLRLHPGCVALVTNPDAATPFGAGHIAIALPNLSETERRDVWARACAEAKLPADVDTLAARYRIGPGVIRRAIASVIEPVADPTAALDAFVCQTRDARLSQFARRVDRLASWASIVLPPDILDSLRELIARVRYRKTVFDTWGMGKTLATSRGLTALFQGAPGTGKTLVAGVIARELGLELYQVDLAKVMSKWIGETERNLAQIFDAAEDGQVVLLFDEADSLFAKRTEVRSSNDRYANLEVNYLLQRLDSFEGIAILTTNAGTSIDQAFKRRMSFRLSFPFPDEETRAQLWRTHLPPELPVQGELALDVLARKYQLSGGYIRNACTRAAFLAAQQASPLQQHHLERAVALEFAELGKLSTNGAID